MWKNIHLQRSPQSILDLELVDCKVSEETVAQLFKVFPSISVTLNGKEIENEEGILKTEGEYFFEGTLVVSGRSQQLHDDQFQGQ